MTKEDKKNAYLYCKFRDEQFAMYDAYAKRHGMLMKTLLVVNVLFYAPDGLTQRDICGKTFQSKQSVNLVVKNLLAGGYVTVTEIPENKRTKVVHMTESGCTHACKYCYASFMKRFTNHPEEWGTFLDVKYWPEIKNPQKYCGKELFFGSVTDPYNPQEETYRRTRSLLEQLQGSGVRLSIQTKSDLVLRDIDLIKTFPDARVGFSINTLDESFKNDMDQAVSIEHRIASMKKLHEEGIRTTCFISPIFPGITDCEEIIERVKEQCNLVWLENLNLRGSYKSVILQYIRGKHPELMPLYEEIYTHGSRLYWETLDAKMRDYAEQVGLPYVRNDDSMCRPFEAPPVIVNFFYHEEIRKSSRMEVKGHA